MAASALPILALGVVAGSTSPAPSATVVVICDDNAALDELGAHLAERLSGGGWQVSRSPSSTPSWRRLCDRDAVRARALLEEAKDSFHNFKLTAARSKLATAVALLEGSEWIAAGPDTRSVYVYVGWVERERGNDAEEHFRTSVRLWPSWRPNPLQYPPDVVEAYGRLAHQTAKEPTGSLTIETRPVGAVATLNGELECSSPCGFPQLLPGEHFLTVYHRDHGAMSRRLVVKAGSPQHVRADLAGDERSRWWRLNSELELPAEAAPSPGNDLVVVLSMSTAQVIQRGSRTALPVGGDPRAAVERILEAVASPDTVPLTTPDPAAATTQAPQQGRSLATEPWLWAALATAAATAAVGGYFLLRPDNVKIRVNP